jgi:hypothetical protein
MKNMMVALKEVSHRKKSIGILPTEVQLLAKMCENVKELL